MAATVSVESKEKAVNVFSLGLVYWLVFVGLDTLADKWLLVDPDATVELGPIVVELLVDEKIG